MADPRAVFETKGMGQEEISFKFDSTIVFDATKERGSASIDLAVAPASAGTVKLTEDGEAVVGKLVRVHSDGWCGVILEGGVELPGGASASLTVGKKIVGALGAASAKGYVREVATATAAELGVARGMILDASTATKVKIWL